MIYDYQIASPVSQMYANLAAVILLDAIEAARAGDLAAREWLLYSRRVMIICSGLNISHSELIARIDRPLKFSRTRKLR